MDNTIVAVQHNGKMYGFAQVPASSVYNYKGEVVTSLWVMTIDGKVILTFQANSPAIMLHRVLTDVMDSYLSGQFNIDVK